MIKLIAGFMIFSFISCASMTTEQRKLTTDIIGMAVQTMIAIYGQPVNIYSTREPDNQTLVYDYGQCRVEVKDGIAETLICR